LPGETIAVVFVVRVVAAVPASRTATTSSRGRPVRRPSVPRKTRIVPCSAGWPLERTVVPLRRLISYRDTARPLTESANAARTRAKGRSL